MKRDIDKYFPRNGPCMFHSTRYARHRLIDALRDNYRAGDSIDSLVENYDFLSREAIEAAVHSTPDDNRMTPKEIREGREMWKQFAKEMKAKRKAA